MKYPKCKTCGGSTAPTYKWSIRGCCCEGGVLGALDGLYLATTVQTKEAA